MKNTEYSININSETWKRFAIGVVFFLASIMLGYVLFTQLTNNGMATAQETITAELKGVVESVDLLNDFFIISHISNYENKTYKIRIFYDEKTVVEEKKYLMDWGVEYPDNFIKPSSARKIISGERIHIKYETSKDRFKAIYVQHGNLPKEIPNTK